MYVYRIQYLYWIWVCNAIVCIHINFPYRLLSENNQSAAGKIFSEYNSELQKYSEKAVLRIFPLSNLRLRYFLSSLLELRKCFDFSKFYVVFALHYAFISFTLSCNIIKIYNTDVIDAYFKFNTRYFELFTAQIFLNP